MTQRVYKYVENHRVSILPLRGYPLSIAGSGTKNIMSRTAGKV